MSDELVERSRAGDQDAYAELVEPLRRPLFNLALRMLNDREAAGDVVQESLIRGWVNLGKLERGLAFRAWMYRATANLCHDHGRRLQRRPEQELDENVIQMPTSDPGPESLTVARETRESIASALHRLPHEFRVAVVLRDVNDLSYDQIAEVLGVPVGTVRSRISRGRAEMRRLIDPSGMPRSGVS